VTETTTVAISDATATAGHASVPRGPLGPQSHATAAETNAAEPYAQHFAKLLWTRCHTLRLTPMRIATHVHDHPRWPVRVVQLNLQDIRRSRHERRNLNQDSTLANTDSLPGTTAVKLFQKTLFRGIKRSMRRCLQQLVD